MQRTFPYMAVYLLLLSACTEKSNMITPRPVPLNISQKTDTAISVSIVPTAYSMDMTGNDISAGNDTSYLELENKKHFFVLLKNTTNHSVNIWEGWNSWGYFNLTFEIFYSDGKRETISKNETNWFKNFPSFYSIAPGGYHIFEISFDEEWETSLHSRRSPTICRMKAIYVIPADSFSTAYDVWTGKAESTTNDYYIWH